MGMSFFPFVLLLCCIVTPTHGRMAPEALEMQALQQEEMQFQLEDAVNPQFPPGFVNQPVPPIMPMNLMALFDEVMDDDSDDDAPMPHPAPHEPLPDWLSHESPMVILPTGELMGLHQLHDTSTAVSHVAMSPLYFSIMRRLMTSTMGEFCSYMATILPSLINLVYGNVLPSEHHGYYLTINGITLLYNQFFNVGMFPSTPIMDYHLLITYGFQTFQSYMQIHSTPFVNYQYPTDLLFYACPWVSPETVPVFVGMAQPLLIYHTNDMVQALAVVTSEAAGVLGHEQEVMLSVLGMSYDADAYLNDVVFVEQNSDIFFDSSVIHENDYLMHPEAYVGPSSDSDSHNVAPLSPMSALIAPVAPPSPNVLSGSDAPHMFGISGSGCG